ECLNDRSAHSRYPPMSLVEMAIRAVVLMPLSGRTYFEQADSLAILQGLVERWWKSTDNECLKHLPRLEVTMARPFTKWAYSQDQNTSGGHLQGWVILRQRAGNAQSNKAFWWNAEYQGNRTRHVEELLFEKINLCTRSYEIIPNNACILFYIP